MSTNQFKDILRRHAAGDTPAQPSVADAAAPEPAPESGLPPPVAIENTAHHATPPSASEIDDAEAIVVQQDNIRIASECIAAGLVTPKQCQTIEQRIQDISTSSNVARFEEIAVQLGFCNRVQVAELQEELRSRELLKDRYVPSAKIYGRPPRDASNNSLMGTRMVSAGLITAVQRDKIVEKQQKLALQGAQIRFGELALQLGYCTEAELDALLEDIKARESNQSW